MPTTLTRPKRHRPLIKIFGGKNYLATRILEHLPTDGVELFVDGCGGGGSLTFSAAHVYPNRVYNDLWLPNYCMMRAVRDCPADLATSLEVWPYEEASFLRAKALYAERMPAWRREDPKNVSLADCVSIATLHVVVSRMSRMGAGEAFAIGTRTRGGRPGDINAWHTAIDYIPNLHLLLQGVHITCRPVQHWLGYYGSDVLLYIDPPYPRSTRVSKDVYYCEMGADDESDHKAHEDLLARCLASKSKIALSSYRNPLYDTRLSGWRCVEFEIANHASQSRSKQRKIEALYLNF
jgi:site-specific DNA-adenine methylase